jgi:uroporphyrinogen-III synthase
MTKHTKYTVLTRDSRANRRWSHLLRTYGLSPYSFPCISTIPATLTPDITSTLRNLSFFDWIIFTSAAGVRHFMSLSTAQGTPFEVSALPKIAGVGKRTAEEIKKLGRVTDFIPQTQNADTLATTLKNVAGKRLLIIQGSRTSSQPAQILTNRLAQVTTLPLYETRLNSRHSPKLESLIATKQVGHIVFASPSAVQGFVSRLTPPSLATVLALPALAIGTTTAQGLRQAGFRDVRVALEPTPAAIAKLIE